MNRKIVAPALAMMALAGCSLSRSDAKKKADQVTPTVFNTNSDRPGRVLEPKYCKLDSAIVSRPVGDKVVDASLWNVADEQLIPIELRQALEANGLRVGVITGSLPVDVLEAFKPSPPQKETQWVHIALPEGEHTPIVVGSRTETVTLLLNHQGKVDGRDYHDAEGRLIVTPGHSGSKSVSLRIVPEVHHGETRRTIAPLQNNAPFAQQEFSIKDGQQEDILRELGVTVDLQPNQTLVLGCRAQQARSLGTFLFTQPEPNSDRMLQSVLLIQATRNKLGEAPMKLDGEPAELPDLAVRPIPMPSKDAKASSLSRPPIGHALISQEGPRQWTGNRDFGAEPGRTRRRRPSGGSPTPGTTDRAPTTRSVGRRASRGSGQGGLALATEPGSKLITLDGSSGEGGGQILRTALTLSMLTGRPFRIVKIRANRDKPGLRPQHLKAVEAAAMLGGAEVSGGSIGSRDLTFRPGQIEPRDLRVDIGTAGATSLVLQTLHLPLALRSAGPVRLTLKGGTYNESAPSFPFLETTWRAHLAGLGMPVALSMPAAGYYPEGGGSLEAWIEPATPRSLVLENRGDLVKIRGMAETTNLPAGIGRRMADRAIDRPGRSRVFGRGRGLSRSPAHGQGASITLVAEFTNAPPATFVGVGKRGKPAEAVADEAVEGLLENIEAAEGAVDYHSADQILLPLAFAEGRSVYTVTHLTEHLRTNIRTIGAFLDRPIRVEEVDGGAGGRVVVG